MSIRPPRRADSRREFRMTTLEKIADLDSFVTVGGMTTQRNRHFFGNIFGGRCVCIGDCKLRGKKRRQSGGLSNENKFARQNAG
jgi:hypothetical protein